jgi:predicted RNA binding protein YcfA (HicA-like mRNA interferase family)
VRARIKHSRLLGIVRVWYDGPVKYRELLQTLHADGWRHDHTRGSHMMYVHPTKPGPIVVPAGGKQGQDVPRGTLNSILKQAGSK